MVSMTYCNLWLAFHVKFLESLIGYIFVQLSPLLCHRRKLSVLRYAHDPRQMQFLSGITKNWFVFLSQLPFVLSPATLLSCIIEYHQLKKTWFVNIEYIIDKFKRISMINRKWFKPINRIDFIFWSKNYNGEGFMLFLNKNLFSNPLIHFNGRWNPR